MKTVKKRALKAAMRAIPMLGCGDAYRRRLSDFQRGYMTGHASMTRHASKIAGQLERLLAEAEGKLEEAVEERDTAEETVSDIYFRIIGKSPEWSNNFGFQQAIEEITEGFDLVRAAAKGASAYAKQDTLPQVSHTGGDTPRAVGVARMHDNDRAILVCLDRRPTDDELRGIHDLLAGRTV